MKKFMLIPLLVLLFACGPASDPQEAESTVSITAPDPLSITCITGFTRTAPRYCLADVTSSMAWTDAAGCTARTLANAIPIGASVDLDLTWRALANLAIGFRYNSVLFYPNASCTGGYKLNEHAAYEHVAVVAGNELTRDTLRVTGITIVGAAGQIYAAQTNAGGNGNADILQAVVVGYYN